MEKKDEKFERDPYVRYVCMNEEQAWKALGRENTEKVEDKGPADPTRYREGSRLFFIYPMTRETRMFNSERS